MKYRKTILLSAIAVLLCIYIVQLVTAGQSSIKNLVLKSEPTSYTINNNGESVVISKNGDIWTVGKENFKANKAFVDNIKDAVANIKAIDTVSHSENDAVLERYGLSKDSSFTVTASDSNGKILRTILIGKESTTGSQTYAKVDGGKDIYLVSGSLKNTFAKSVDDLRSNEVFSFKADELTKVSITVPGNTWTFEKNEDQTTWSANDKNVVLDNDKVSSWIKSLPVLSVQNWRNESEKLPKIAGTTVTLSTAQKDYVVNVYEIQNDDKTEYIGTSSETPYSFTMTSYTGEKFCKKLSDFIANTAS